MKIIICGGNANTPVRFWSWAVCTEEEYLEKELNKKGWVLSKRTNYLNSAQLKYLNE